jgi:hypothetical protein
MNAITIHFTAVTGKTSLASAGIALAISSALGTDLIDNPQSAKAFLARNCGDYDAFIVNGPWAFCDFRPECMELVADAKDVYWVQNDYTIEIPSPLRRPMVLLSTIVGGKLRGPLEGTRYMNWNALTYTEPTLPVESQSQRGLFYYGAFRKDREGAFRNYFATDFYPVTISCSARAAASFKQLCPAATIAPIMQTIRQARRFAATVYMEDVTSHNLYCSPANRFYECLSAGIPMAFDAGTVGTMTKAGFDVSLFVVEQPSDVEVCMQKSLQMGKLQRQMWCNRDYRGEVIARLKGTMA